MDSITMIYGHYETYKQICEQHNVELMSVCADFYTHGRELTKNSNVYNEKLYLPIVMDCNSFFK